jgi:hypothetical protein
MKNTFKVLGIIALIAIIGLSFASCGDDDDSGGSSVTYDPVEYKSSRSGTTYSLKITKNEGKAAFTPSNGDFYTLTITTAGVSLTSNGTISISGNHFTLTHTATGTSFTVTISSGEMITINGTDNTQYTIPVDSGEEVTAPGFVLPESSGGGNGSFLGANLIINEEQVYWRGRDWETGGYTYSLFTGTAWGFNYLPSYIFGPVDQEILMLSECIDGLSIWISDGDGGKLSFCLGTPKASAPNMIDIFKTQYPNLTISPNDAKSFFIIHIYNNENIDNSSFIGHYDTKGYGLVFYWYTDKNVTINGTDIDGTNTINFALDLKTGWNSVVVSFMETGISVKTEKPSDDYKWILGNSWD